MKYKINNEWDDSLGLFDSLDYLNFKVQEQGYNRVKKELYNYLDSLLEKKNEVTFRVIWIIQKYITEEHDKSLYSYIEKIITTCDDYMKPEMKISILGLIDDPYKKEKYLKKNYNDLKKFFEKTVILVEGVANDMDYFDRKNCLFRISKENYDIVDQGFLNLRFPEKEYVKLLYKYFYKEIKFMDVQREAITKFNPEWFINFDDASFRTLRMQLEKQASVTDELEYLREFQSFLKRFTKNYDDKLDNADIKVVMTLYNRARKSLKVDLLSSISCKSSLYHCYKTGEYIRNLNLSLDEVHQYNAKQYLKLKELLYPPANSSKEAYFNSYNNNLQAKGIIESLNTFSYDLSKKIIEEEMNDYIFEALKEDEEYNSKLKEFLQNNFEYLKKDKGNLRINLNIFSYLYELGISKITFNKMQQFLVEPCLLPNNISIKPYIKKLNLITKGNVLETKLMAIKLYDEYRLRLSSSIPTIKGVIDDCKYEMVDMHSPSILSDSIANYLMPDNKVATSCLSPLGAAGSDFEHGALHKNGRFMKTVHNGNILAYSWVWRCGDVLCFDNIEVTDEKYKIENSDEKIYQSYRQAAISLQELTKNEKNGGIKLVIIGRGKKDIKNEKIDNLEKVNDYTNTLFSPNEKDLYLNDSNQVQVIIAGEYNKNLNLEDIEEDYLYERKKVERFNNSDKKKIEDIINSIYFSYCFQNGKKYSHINNDYSDGYFNEDWFIGYREDQSYDFYYIKNDDRLEKEVNQYILPKIPKINIVTNKTPIVIDEKNIEIEVDEEKLSDYLNSLTETINTSNASYSHSTNINNLYSILKSGAILSDIYFNSTGGWNGSYYISLAKLGTGLNASYQSLKDITLLINNDLEAFECNADKVTPHAICFTNSRYPIRYGCHDEFQAYDRIDLDNVTGILIKKDIAKEIGKIVYLEDIYNYDIPIALKDSNKEIDKNEIKKLVNIKCRK